MTVPAPVVPALGPPGVQLGPDAVPRGPLGVRMDVCAFVGVAPRGPAWERLDDPALEPDALAAGRCRSVAVPVESWSEYEDRFGGHAGPGLLPRAVAAFFAQGGRRAHIVRIVPRRPRPAPEPPGCSLLRLDADAVSDGAQGSVHLRARNEGTWGDRLSATLSFDAAPVPVPTVAGTDVTLPPGLVVPGGTVLRLHAEGGAPSLHGVTTTGRRAAAEGWERYAVLDRPFAGTVAAAEIVTASLEVADADPDRPRREAFTGLGLRAGHPRWLGTVLADSSHLVELALGGTEIRPREDLPPAGSSVVTLGADRYADLQPDDVFGADPPDAAAAPAGLDALRDLDDCASVCVPDLYAPIEQPADEDVRPLRTLAGAGFAECVPLTDVPPAVAPAVDLAGLRLDPALPDERARITDLQRRVVTAAERLDLVALLDVPPGLRPGQALAWRAAFDSSYAAAYLGWPLVPAPSGERLMAVPPSAYAAGTIAVVERERGPGNGPAQLPLVGAVGVLDGPASAGRAGGADPLVLGTLHRAGLNITLRDRSAVRISAARTMAADPAWAQLTARRVVTGLERSLLTALAWAVFEPNGPVLRDGVRVCVTELLGGLLTAGGLAGGVPADAYFVRIPEAGAAGLGEADLLCEIGVAPSAPLEFLVVRVLRADDGSLTTVGGSPAGSLR